MSKPDYMTLLPMVQTICNYVSKVLDDYPTNRVDHAPDHVSDHMIDHADRDGHVDRDGHAGHMIDHIDHAGHVEHADLDSKSNHDSWIDYDEEYKKLFGELVDDGYDLIRNRKRQLNMLSERNTVDVDDDDAILEAIDEYKGDAEIEDARNEALKSIHIGSDIDGYHEALAREMRRILIKKYGYLADGCLADNHISDR